MNNIELNEINKRISNNRMTSKDAEILVQLVTIKSSNLDAWLTLIYAAWVNKFPVLDRWEEYYQKVINLDENEWSDADYLRIYSLAHELYAYDENYGGEQITAEAMYDIEPQNWIHMALLAEVTDNRERALELAKSIHNHFPNNGDVLLRVGHIYRELAFRYRQDVLLEKSINMYEQAIKYLVKGEKQAQATKIVNKLRNDLGTL